MPAERRTKDFSALLRPKSVAIVGASANGSSPGNRLIKILAGSGFAGNLYVLHPKTDRIDGIKAYRSFEEMPETIDYAFVCVPAAAVPDLVKDAHGRVRFMQVMTSGFGEIREGVELNERLRAELRGSDVRLLGPNCIGMHSSAGRIGFIENASYGKGSTAVVSQSGGLSIDILRRGQQMGIEFSSVISVGNSLDLGASELIGHHLDDPDVRAIGLYVENVGNGRQLFEHLRRARARKPVVILKGGMTGEGSRAAASHTGAMAEDERTWRALADQTGSILVGDLSVFLNLLGLFQAYPSETCDTRGDVVLVGNGGGASVIAADHFARQGMSLHEFSDDIVERLARVDVPAGSSLRNPVDVPANALRGNNGRAMSDILSVLSESKGIGAVVMHLNLTVFAGYDGGEMADNAFNALVRMRDRLASSTKVVFVARSDYSIGAASQSLAFRKKGIELGIPVFDELGDVAVALGAMKHLSSFRKRRGIAAD